MTNLPEDLAGLVEVVADAMDRADTGHSLRLTRLVDGESTYTVTCCGETREFPDTDEAYEWVGRLKREVKATAALHTIAPALEQALSPELEDFELEDALKEVGIFVYGPDATNFEAMFTAAMRTRRAALARGEKG